MKFKLFSNLYSLGSLHKALQRLKKVSDGVGLLCSVLQSRPLKPPGTRVLVLGLNGAGKTSLLRYWATGSLEQDVHPSEGFNAVSINKDDLHIEFLESEPELCLGSEVGRGVCSRVCVPGQTSVFVFPSRR